MAVDAVRFVAASELGRSDDLCDPTEDYWDGRIIECETECCSGVSSVSVPWAIITPSAP